MGQQLKMPVSAPILSLGISDFTLSLISISSLSASCKSAKLLFASGWPVGIFYIRLNVINRSAAFHINSAYRKHCAVLFSLFNLNQLYAR